MNNKLENAGNKNPNFVTPKAKEDFNEKNDSKNPASKNHDPKGHDQKSHDDSSNKNSNTHKTPESDD